MARSVDPWERLVNWVVGHGVSVVRGRSSFFDPETKTISIAASAPRPLHDLAHECGHLHLGHSRAQWAHNVVREELDAWRAGRALLRRLRIAVDPYSWEQDVSRSMRCHFRWALRQPALRATEERPVD